MTKNETLHRARIVADRLLRVPRVCAVCNFPIRLHSTGNYFHLAPVDKFHKATIIEWEPAPQWAKDAKEDDRKREAV